MTDSWNFRFITILGLLSLLAIFLSPISTNGQFASMSLDEIVSVGEENVRQYYEKDLDVFNFINGKVYDLRYLNVEGSQFITGDYFERGTLEYNDVLFKNIPLQYDVYQQLVITIFDSGHTSEYISIDNDEINWFTFNGMKFINYGGELLAKGIYQEFYRGNNSLVLIKTVKEIVRNHEQARLYHRFNAIDELYLLDKNESYRINSKKDLVRALGNDIQVRKYIRSMSLRFDKTSIANSVAVVKKYYDEYHSGQ